MLSIFADHLETSLIERVAENLAEGGERVGTGDVNGELTALRPTADRDGADDDMTALAARLTSALTAALIASELATYVTDGKIVAL